MIEPVYIDIFESRKDVEGEFLVELPDDVEILFAEYSYENYSGDAFVLFRQNGELYEVYGGHCSCYGLEGQWEPEKTSLAALERELSVGSLRGKESRLAQIVQQL